MSAERRGLGRGLGALLGGDGSSEGRTVSIDSIEPNPYQPRDNLESDDLQQLAASIRSHGLIQPLVVTPYEGGYRLIAGERRWRAARLAGLSSVPVVVREATPRDMLAVALIENVQRANLDPMEAATAYRRLADEFELTHADVAELVGKSRTTVTNAVRLLGLEPEVQQMLRAGSLSEGHGRALLALAPGAHRVGLGRRAAREQWSVREVERAARAGGNEEALPGPPSATPQELPARADANERAAVKALEEALGTRVELRRKGSGGSLIVYFYSGEELNALYDKMRGRATRAQDPGGK